MNESNTIYLDMPANFKYLSVLSACLAEMLVKVENLTEPDLTIYNVQLAIQEACTNIVEHAYDGQSDRRFSVTLTLDDASNHLIVELEDTGQPFDKSHIEPPDLDTAQEGGYGLFLMYTLLDEVVYAPQPGRNYWRLVKQLVLHD
jgi:serine/threonine-protein kinase RsbW